MTNMIFDMLGEHGKDARHLHRVLLSSCVSGISCYSWVVSFKVKSLTEHVSVVSRRKL